MQMNLQQMGKWTGVALGAIFIVAAASKGTDLVRFWRQIEAIYESIGLPPTQLLESLAITSAIMVSMIELILGAMLITQFNYRTATIGSLILLVGFTVFLTWAIVTKSVSECGCFGALHKQSPGAAMIEDIVMLLMAVIAMFAERTARPKAKRSTLMIVGFGMVWLLMFYLIPPSWAALQTGTVWKSSDTTTTKNVPYLMWTFDPDCFECQSQVNYLNNLSTSDYPIVALTDASSGKVQEFIWDFEPIFNIEIVNSNTIDQMGLYLGSLVLVQQNRVQQIWHPKRLPKIGDIEKFIILQ
jgi:hypothetical protein